MVNPEKGDNPSLKCMIYPGSPKTTAFWRGVSVYNSIVFLETTVILVEISNQQLQGTIVFMVFDLLGIFFE